VVPLALQTSELMAVLSRVSAAHNISMEMLTVGSPGNRINPTTGAPEFGSSDIFSLKDNLFMSGAGRNALKEGEGYKPEPYPDIAGNITSGFGHKGTLTHSAEEHFDQDVAKADRAVNHAVEVPITQAERDALGSLAYNIGAGNFASSTIPALINSGQYLEAANAFSLFNKARNPHTGKLEPSNGLSNRGQRERDQFLDHTLIVRASRLP